MDCSNSSDMGQTDVDMGEDGENLDANNLIINYLPESTTQDDLYTMFEAFGKIDSCKLIRHRTLGHSLGYGFVKFEKHEDASNAIEALNGLMMKSKKLKVSFARPSTDPIKTANLYICGLKNTITDAELIGVFSPYGKVLTVKVMNNDNDPNKTSAIGFVRFEKHSNAQNAMEALNGTTPAFNPSAIHVSFAKQSAQQTPPPMPMKPLPYPPSFPVSRFAGYGGKTPSIMAKNMSGVSRFDPLGRNCMSRGGMTDGLFPMPDMYGDNGAVGHVLFVFNLSPEVQELHLWRLFGPYGAIRSVNVVMDKATNRSKGYAFITMNNYAEAEEAIMHLHQTSLEGKVIQVSFKRPKLK